MAASGTRFFAAFVCLSVAWLAPAQPADLHLAVRTRLGQTTFRIGEEIPLELSFSSDAPQKYQIDFANYDASGRPKQESFTVQPRAGWSDPLDFYFRSVNFPGGPYSSFQPLPAQPFVLSEDLNDWVRFDQPGEYRIAVRSYRVRMQTLLSNELALTIVAATPEWQQETLQRALTGIDNPVTRFASAKALRDLGTEAAAREMAKRTQDQECRLGLIGSPFRSAGLEEMRKRMRDPSAPIDRQFLDTLAFLTIPEKPGQHFQEYIDSSARLQQELLTMIPLKKGPALTASVRAILENPRGVTPDVRQSLSDILLANFDDLPVMEQADLLRNPATAPERAILPAMLRKIAERYQEFPQPQSIDALNFNRVCGDALVEWYELDPVGARPAIVREILRPNPRFSLDVLGILPDRELPEIEPKLVEHFKAATDRVAARNLAALIARYAGTGAETELLARLDQETAGGVCDTQAPLLAWLIRVDPQQAAQRLQKSGAPGNTCRVSLAEIGKVQPGAALENLAVKALDSADGNAVADGASYLQDNGSAAAEATLWSHFDAWSARWKGHEPQLNVSMPDVRAGQGLFQALLMGNGWLMSDAKLQRLSDLSIQPALRQQAEQYRRIWQNKPWLIRAVGYDQYQIGWYHAASVVVAKRKLSQFPKGTELRWIMQGLPSDSADFKELAQFASQYGVRIW